MFYENLKYRNSGLQVPGFDVNPVDEMGRTPMEVSICTAFSCLNRSSQAPRHYEDCSFVVISKDVPGCKTSWTCRWNDVPPREGWIGTRRYKIPRPQKGMKILLIFWNQFSLVLTGWGWKQALDAKRKEYLSLARRPLVQAVIVNSKEWVSLSSAEEGFIPGLELLLDELWTQSQMIHNAMEGAAPFCKHFLLAQGLSVSFETSHDSCFKNSPDFLVKNMSKVKIAST